ncbi:hypothetical protein CL620_02440, partial [archaeon]|nr:hypothetical protein [archaeon]
MKHDKEICPKCGSSEWTFPNPIKASESTLNLPHFVNNLYECTNCGYIGPFFIMDKEQKVDIITPTGPRTLDLGVDIRQEKTFGGWLIAAVIAFFGFLA